MTSRRFLPIFTRRAGSMYSVSPGFPLNASSNNPGKSHCHGWERGALAPPRAYCRGFAFFTYLSNQVIHS